MYFLGMLTDGIVIFCRPRICLFKTFADGANPVVGIAAK